MFRTNPCFIFDERSIASFPVMILFLRVLRRIIIIYLVNVVHKSCFKGLLGILFLIHFVYSISNAKTIVFPSNNKYSIDK